MHSHDAVVNCIAATVRGFFTRREGFRINHGSTNSTRPAHNSQVVDISMLNNIIEVNEDSRTAVVEPNVPMDKLVQATLARGLVPPVVMEFPGITVGGGFAGSAGESSSFRYGYFDQTVNLSRSCWLRGRWCRHRPWRIQTSFLVQLARQAPWALQQSWSLTSSRQGGLLNWLITGTTPWETH
jgi:hypothetical protein